MATAASFSGTSTVRLGIYNETNGLPSTVLLDAGTVSATAASTIYEITISQSLNPGFYWLAVVQQSAPTTPNYYGLNSNGGAAGNPFLNSSATVTGNGNLGYQQSSVSGAFATATSLSATTAPILVCVRAA